MIILTLLAKMIACSLILFAYYWLFLRNKRFHHYNRFYLLAATLLSITIPFIRIPVFFEPYTATAQIVNRSIDIISVNRWEKEFLETPSSDFSSLFTLQAALFFVYGTITLVLGYILGRSLVYIRNLSKKYPYEYINALKFYNTTEPGTPFSFFHSIFWNKTLDPQSKEGHQIFRHELFHVRQQHSADILFLEIVTIFFWFNPVFYLIKKEVKAIHEFLADQHAITDDNQQGYAELLILQSINIKKSSISNYFFQNHIKRRIAMITQLKNKKYGYWTRLMVLPLSIILFCAIALHAKAPGKSPGKKPSREHPSKLMSQSLTVLIDAGHGGKDAGVKADNGVQEKDLALAIAKQIQQYASSYNIKTVMTRNEDVYPSLKERSGMAESVKADLIVSVHVGATEPGTNTNSGFSIFITNKNQQTVDQSKLLGVDISNEIKNLYTIGPIQQRKEAGIWILDAVNCPAVLIECGYITNEKDVAFISKPENQGTIAKSILEGIMKYQAHKLTDTIPVTKSKNDTLGLPSNETRAQMERKLTQQHIAHRQLMEKQVQKQRELELLQRKMEENRDSQMKNQERLQMKLEQQREQQTLNTQRISELRNQQRLQVQKQQELELIQGKLEETRTVQMQNQQRLQMQQDQLKEDLINTERNNEVRNQQRLHIQKQNDRAIMQQKINEEKLAEIESQQRVQLNRQQELEALQRKLSEISITEDSLPNEALDRVFTKVEVDPEYPGGEKAWQSYINKNLRYPSDAMAKNISGTVIVQFIVDKNGGLSNVEAIKGPKELREEAERIIRESGVWLTAKQNGHVVKAYRRQPIVFKIVK